MARATQLQRSAAELGLNQEAKQNTLTGPLCQYPRHGWFQAADGFTSTSLSPGLADNGLLPASGDQLSTHCCVRGFINMSHCRKESGECCALRTPLTPIVQRGDSGSEFSDPRSQRKPATRSLLLRLSSLSKVAPEPTDDPHPHPTPAREFPRPHKDGSSVPARAGCCTPKALR